MASSFENPHSHSAGEASTSPEEVVSEKDRQYLASIDAIQPTGDLVTDARHWDALTLKGFYASQLDSPENAFKILCDWRGVMERTAAESTDSHEHPWRTMVWEKNIAAMTRLITHYSVDRYWEKA